MKPRVILPVVGAFVGVLIAAQGYRAAQSARRLAAEANRELERGAVFRERLGKLETELSESERECRDLAAVLKKKRFEKGEAPSAIRAQTTGATRRQPVPFSPQEVLRGDPELQALYLEAERGILVQRYAPLVEELGLTGAQRRMLHELLAEYVEKIVDLQGAAETHEVALDDPAVETLRREAEAQLRAAQKSLLGESAYAELLAFERTLPVREAVDALAGQLVFGDMPLKPQQAERLTQILAEASRNYRNGGSASKAVFDSDSLNFTANGSLTPDGWTSSYPEDFDWPLVLQQARAVLSPAQLHMLEAVVQKDVSATRLFNLAQAQRLSRKGEPDTTVSVERQPFENRRE